MPSSINATPLVCFDLIAAITAGDATALSNKIDINGITLCGLIVPSNFVGTKITFATSDDLNITNFGNYRKADGTDFIITVAAPISPASFSHIQFQLSDFAGVRYVQLRAGVPGTPVTQTSGDVLIKLVGRPVS